MADDKPKRRKWIKREAKKAEAKTAAFSKRRRSVLYDRVKRS